MPFVSFNLPGNSHVVRKFDNVATDFPTHGVTVNAGSNGIAIAVDTVTGANLTVQVTFDPPAAINAGTAKWYPYTAGTTNTASSNYIIISIAPSGIKLAGSTAGAAILT